MCKSWRQHQSQRAILPKGKRSERQQKEAKLVEGGLLWFHRGFILVTQNKENKAQIKARRREEGMDGWMDGALATAALIHPVSNGAVVTEQTPAGWRPQQ